jgi:predicted SAM-dependent methyltransferase
MNSFLPFIIKILNLIIIKFKRFIVTKIIRSDTSRMFFCPICKSSFYSFDPKLNLFKKETIRKKEKCPKCKSLKRHRFIYLFLEKIGLLKNPKLKVLHIAPEECFSKIFEKIWNKNYITADLNNKNVKIKMDITNIPFKNETFDFILCSHVLEHVENDKKAMSEFLRVLSKNGIVVIMVPIFGKETYENPKIKSPEERLKYFGQKDHVRKYGLDIIKKMEKIGFKVKIIIPKNILSQAEIKKYVLGPNHKIFLLYKNKK